jgi:hypothetical protein
VSEARFRTHKKPQAKLQSCIFSTLDFLTTDGKTEASITRTQSPLNFCPLDLTTVIILQLESACLRAVITQISVYVLSSVYANA